MQVEIIALTNYVAGEGGPEGLLEHAGRTCYRSLGRGQPGKFLQARIREGHESLVEHASVTFEIGGISRACSHQLVRHRIASYCLAGDTEVVAYTATKGRKPKRWTLEKLWNWQSDPVRKGRLRLIRLRGVNDRCELIPVPIHGVLETGAQEVFQVRTSSGRAIKATSKHRFLTPDGWKRLGEINVGDTVYSNGEPAYKSREYLEQRYLVENIERKVLAAELGVADSTLGKWIRKFGLQKQKSQYPNRQPGRGRAGMFTDEQKQEISARMCGDENHQWLGNDASDNAGRLRAQKLYATNMCRRCDSANNLVRHHKDGNPLNNAPDNVETLCEPCHKAVHVGQAVLVVFRDEITSIEPAGIMQTYDLEIGHPCHCYVANGLVVHNSQESQRYVAMDAPELVVPPAIQENPEALAAWDEFMARVPETYRRLRRAGVRKEDARFILPNATATRIVVTMNFRALRHFFAVRCDRAAQWEIRALALEMLRQMHDLAPAAFEDLYRQFLGR